tara:strand:+ start:704 stop:1237 length:534 start_codon:yes stop_codon:yes gene_type:complete
MLVQEFQLGIKKLITIFTPKGWEDATADAYFASVRRWTVEEWDDVVEEAIKTCDWMPRPKKLLTLKLDLMGRDSETGESKPGGISDCECCFNGTILFTVEKNGTESERLCACTCDAGKRQLMNSYGGKRMMSYLEVFNKRPIAVKSKAPNLSENTTTSQQLLAEAEALEHEDDGLPF